MGAGITMIVLLVLIGVVGAIQVARFEKREGLGRPGGYKYRLVRHKYVMGRGYVVERVTDHQRLRWTYLRGKDGLRALSVHGEAYHMDDLQSPTFRPGKELLLVRQPDHPVDPNAIAVFDKKAERQAGYVPAKNAKRLARRLDRGDKVRCISLWEEWNEHQLRASLRVLLVDEGAPVKLR